MIEGKVVVDEEMVLQVLANIPAAIEAASSDAAKTIRLLALGRTPYKTGLAKSSWGGIEKASGGYSFSNPVPYMGILEEGLYSSVGPRTVKTKTGIFSRQTPGGILAPLVDDPKVLQEIAALIVEKMQEGLARAGA